MCKPQLSPPKIDLLLSTLVWQDAPSKSYGDEPHIGMYDVERQPVKLGKPSWSDELQSFVFAPKRDAYALSGSKDSAGYLGTFRGGAWGQGSSAPPLLFLHRISNPRPFVATLRDEHLNEYEADAPPFAFAGSAAESPAESFRASAPHLQLDLPDLGYAFDSSAWEEDADLFEQSLDEDGVASQLGWGRPWTGEITYRVDVPGQQASLIWEKEVWDESEGWGVRLELEPDEAAAERGRTVGREELSGQGVRATLLEVYVKPDFLASASL